MNEKKISFGLGGLKIIIPKTCKTCYMYSSRTNKCFYFDKHTNEACLIWELDDSYKVKKNDIKMKKEGMIALTA